MSTPLFTLILDEIEPFSINKAYYMKTRTRTQECRIWADKVVTKLEAPPNLIQTKKFRDTFDPLNHGIKIKLDYYLPYNKLFTKKGAISGTSKDLTNIEKMLVDILMDKRHYERGISNLNVNDALILSCHSTKNPCTSYKTVVTLQIIELSTMKEAYEAGTYNTMQGICK